MLTLLFLDAAAAYDIPDLDCCHVEEAPATSRPTTITVVALADQRQPLRDRPDAVEKWSLLVGIVRGGYGNPFNLWAARPLRELVSDAVADALSAMGHTAHVRTDGAPKPGADALEPRDIATLADGAALVLHGTVRRWEVDIGSYGSRKVHADVDLFATRSDGRATDWKANLRLEEDGTGLRVLGSNEYTERAEQWYGRKGLRYVEAAIVESALIQLVEALPDPAGGAGASTSSRAAPTASGGCTKDTDCKGERICESRRCVTPN